MKKQSTSIHCDKRQRGFTLVETVIAMGIITIMITAFMASFGPAVQGIRKSMSEKEASRLSTSLEYELSVLRAGEVDDAPDDGDALYVTAFEKAYNWIKGSGTQATMVLIYQYRGDPATVNADGTLAPFAYDADDPGISGEDYVIQTSVRRLNDALVEDELAPGVLEGRVYFAKMSQLIYTAPPSSQMVVTGDAQEILNPQYPNANTTYATYPDAVIAFQTEFYLLPNVLYSYINNTFDITDVDADGHPTATGRPVYTRNMAVRR